MATEEARRRMGHLIAKGYEFGVAMTPKVRYGMESREIVDEASGAGADIIVMSTHGRTRFARALIGASLTQKVARKAPCPVLAVKAGSQMNLRTIRRWDTPSETRTWVA